MTDLTFVLPGLGRNGGVRTHAEWITRYTALGVDCQVVTYAGGPGRDWLPAAVPVRLPRGLYGQSQRVARRLARQGGMPHLDLMLGGRAARRELPARPGRVILGLAALCGAFADIDYTLYAQHWEPLMWPDRSPAAKLADTGMRSGSAVIANSSWLRAHFSGDDHRPVHLVHPGVDRLAYSPRSRPTRASTLRVASLGREDSWKGLNELRTAAGLLGRPVELYLFGTSDVSRRHVGDVTEIRLGGLTSEQLADLYASVDVLVTPSWFESFPLPPLEAMSTGCPVITTPFGTEDYAVDGVNALVVAPNDPPAIRAALDRLAGDPELSRSLVSVGMETAQRFSWDAGFQQLRNALAL